MKSEFALCAALASVLSSCGGNSPQPPSSKLEGAPVETLSRAQVEDIDSQCFVKFGSVDDPRVPYTQNYCRLVETERNRRALTVSKAEQERNQSLLMMGKGKPPSAAANGQ